MPPVLTSNTQIEKVTTKWKIKMVATNKSPKKFSQCSPVKNQNLTLTLIDPEVFYSILIFSKVQPAGNIHRIPFMHCLQ